MYNFTESFADLFAEYNWLAVYEAYESSRVLAFCYIPTADLRLALSASWNVFLLSGKRRQKLSTDIWHVSQ
jgi:hypothetical protein